MKKATEACRKTFIINLVSRSNKWQLRFNTTKCNVMHYSRVNPDLEYHMITNDEMNHIEMTTEENDIGVIFTKDLKFSRHIATAANKENRVVGSIRRAFRYINRIIFTQLYKSMVRAHLEYANTVWNPIKKTDVKHLEKVQRRATKIAPRYKRCLVQRDITTAEAT